MPLFLSEEEFQRCSHDASLVAEKADSFIRDLHRQLETVKAQADAASITAEQTCALLEQKYISLSSEFAKLESQNAQLNATLEQKVSELAEVQADKHQLHLKAISKDAEIEKLSIEASELHKSKRQLLELLEQKDLEIGEKNATIKSYLDKIVGMTENSSQREARLQDSMAELAHSRDVCSRLSQEKELIEKHNAWLNEELTAKVGSLIELRKTHAEYEADMSAKLADVERQLNESSSSLKWNKERVRELEAKLKSTQEELCSIKDAAATDEERLSAEISTVTKLVELYKESSEEWSRKAGELEGVIKALETHLSQVETDYKEKLEKEESARKEAEKEAAQLKEKVEKCEAEIENARKANESSLLPLSSFAEEKWVLGVATDDMNGDSDIPVPRIPVGVSGTALAASLLRDGWSLAKMYAKYQETVDALRHEQLGRKQSDEILRRVLYEIEEKAAVVLDERAEHERMVEAYFLMNKKLQESLPMQSNLERTIQELKADLRRREREYGAAEKEISDLQKQVTVLLKECHDIQLRCGSIGQAYADEVANALTVGMTDESDAEKVISERLLTFKDINGLVEQNVQLRTLVRTLSEENEKIETELRGKFEMELQKQNDEAASKVETVLKRAEDQGRMLESLHSSVSMYKRLHEEELKSRASYPHCADTVPAADGRKDLMLLLEGSQEATKKAHERAVERAKTLKEELEKSKSDALSLRLERDKFAMEANFARERLDSFMKEFEHQRDEVNGVLARNVEFSQLIVEYQRRLRENSDSVHASEELSRKLSMKVSVLKHEKEMLLNSEKRACDEVKSLSERVHRLQASLDTIHSAEQVREDARSMEMRKQEEYIKKLEREWAEAKKELQEERDNVRTLTRDRENTLKNAMKQVEQMGKELADALHAVAAAEARAAVAEARCSDMEGKIKSSEKKFTGVDSGNGSSIASTNEVMLDINKAKEEIEKLKDEAQANKDHMLQYKNIAQVNEAALKQMESAHEEFKAEADKLKKSLEAEIVSLRERISELESDSILKSKEAASTVAGKEEALDSALAEMTSLKEEMSVKMSQIVGMEIQISSLKEDLEKEHQRWRTAQNNYERQVILQSETIQELTKASQALAVLQEEAAELRKFADSQKSENDILKAKWEGEKSLLEKSKNEAERKYNEINEQNNILHGRLEALHIKSAEKERGSISVPSGSTREDSKADGDLQNVIHYLRRSKEIAETEISLLKQEKLRLQSQLETAMKASETAQALLHAERTNSRALLFTDEEFKSLQMQVREMNLLRESNMQLREENKHNFEECQKLREVAQKGRSEIDHLETLLREKQIEVDACQKEIMMQKMEKEHLENRIAELLERCKNIDPEEYDRMKDVSQQMQIKLREKEAEMAETKTLVSEKQDMISRLEQDLANCQLELSKMEKRLNDARQVEDTLKADVDKQKKLVLLHKKKIESVAKEKDDLSKEKLALSKQLEDSRSGKRPIGDATNEQALKEKEKEKDTRIQILEKTLEREREELRKEREDNRKEKVRRLKNEKAMSDLAQRVEMEKKKLVDEFERIKQAKGSLQESGGASVAELPSEIALEDQCAAFVRAVESLHEAANPTINDVAGARPLPVEISPVVDMAPTSAAGRHLTAPAQGTQISMGTIASHLQSKTTEEREKRSNLPKSGIETRKTGRKLIRPRLGRPEEPTGDTEMPELEGPSNSEGKLGASHDIEHLGDLSISVQTSVRKRVASTSASELQEESVAQQETSSDMAAPALKKSRGSDFPQEDAERQPSVPPECIETLPASEETLEAVGALLHASNDESIDVEKDEDADNTKEPVEEPRGSPLDGMNQDEQQDDINALSEETLGKAKETEEDFDEGSKDSEGQDAQQPAMDVEGEREEGELIPDMMDQEGGDVAVTMTSPESGEGQPESAMVPVASSACNEEEVVTATEVDVTETAISEVLHEDKTDGADVKEEITEGSDKSTNDNDQATMETEQSPKAAFGSAESSLSSMAMDSTVSKPVSPSVGADVEQPKDVAAGKSPTTINLNERARQRALLRQAGVVSPMTRGRGRSGVAIRKEGTRGGRGRGRGRGQGSGDKEQN
ncbi:PREDICTED: nuclear-pore anchor isoform X2 [Nelumbo nucifera]|uniref:Nuclear-pore anchor isoform X2 n=2 Tax=Nelumbo nucifera TaxID=4432 RepID=A0A1U8A717_NELNU|nr:PREDICTED: nuclear-pore anchor isoform X2 [Nelumbo nucifera]DAD44115.1 TPA_asm: hypothetical protein HUJ06_002345 [Nelumbo nucifera]